MPTSFLVQDCYHTVSEVSSNASEGFIEQMLWPWWSHWQHWWGGTIWRLSPIKKNPFKEEETEPVLPHSPAQGQQLDLMWGEERERSVGGGGWGGLHNCNESIDHNSCAVTTTIGSAEGLAQVHVHPLSHEAVFNQKSFLAWEKGLLAS